MCTYIICSRGANLTPKEGAPADGQRVRSGKEQRGNDGKVGAAGDGVGDAPARAGDFCVPPRPYGQQRPAPRLPLAGTLPVVGCYVGCPRRAQCVEVGGYKVSAEGENKPPKGGLRSSKRVRVMLQSVSRGCMQGAAMRAQMVLRVKGATEQGRVGRVRRTYPPGCVRYRTLVVISSRRG